MTRARTTRRPTTRTTRRTRSKDSLFMLFGSFGRSVEGPRRTAPFSPVTPFFFFVFLSAVLRGRRISSSSPTQSATRPSHLFQPARTKPPRSSSSFRLDLSRCCHVPPLPFLTCVPLPLSVAVLSSSCLSRSSLCRRRMSHCSVGPAPLCRVARLGVVSLRPMLHVQLRFARRC